MQLQFSGHHSSFRLKGKCMNTRPDDSKSIRSVPTNWSSKTSPMVILTFVVCYKINK